MPNNIVKSFAKKTKLSVEKVESLWMRAKQIAKKEGRDKDYAYITGILKQSLKLESKVTPIDDLIAEWEKDPVLAEHLREARLWLAEFVLSEKAMKEVELFVGRFQPLHMGHATVIGKMKNPVIALVKGSKSSGDASKNPLSVKDQARLIKKVYPNAVVVEVKNGYIPDIALALQEKGMKVTAVWGGEDRRAGYERQLQSYDSKHEPLNIKFKRTFDPSGNRIGGTSATLVRQAIRDGDEETFKKHMHPKLHSEWDFLRKKIK